MANEFLIIFAQQIMGLSCSSRGCSLLVFSGRSGSSPICDALANEAHHEVFSWSSLLPCRTVRPEHLEELAGCFLQAQHILSGPSFLHSPRTSARLQPPMQTALMSTDEPLPYDITFLWSLLHFISFYFLFPGPTRNWWDGIKPGLLCCDQPGT